MSSFNQAQQNFSHPAPSLTTTTQFPPRSSSLAPHQPSRRRPSYESLSSEYSTLTLNAIDRSTPRESPAPLSPLIPTIDPPLPPPQQISRPIRYQAGRQNVPSMAASFGNASASPSASEGETGGSSPGSASVKTYQGAQIHVPSPPRDRYGRSPFDECPRQGRGGRRRRRAGSSFRPRRRRDEEGDGAALVSSPGTRIPCDAERGDGDDEAGRGWRANRRRPEREHRAPPVSMENSSSGLPRRRSSLSRMWGSLKRSLSRGRKASITLVSTAFPADPRDYPDGIPAVDGAVDVREAQRIGEGRSVRETRGDEGKEKRTDRSQTKVDDHQAKRVIKLKPNADRTTKFSDFIHAGYNADLNDSPPLPENVDEILSSHHHHHQQQRQLGSPQHRQQTHTPSWATDDILHIHPAFRNPDSTPPGEDVVGWRMPRAEAEKKKRGDVLPSRPRSPPMGGRKLPDPKPKGQGNETEEEVRYEQLPANLEETFEKLQPRKRAAPAVARAAAEKSWEQRGTESSKRPGTATATPSSKRKGPDHAQIPTSPSSSSPRTALPAPKGGLYQLVHRDRLLAPTELTATELSTVTGLTTDPDVVDEITGRSWDQQDEVRLPEDSDAMFPLRSVEVAPGVFHVKRFFSTGKPVHLTLETTQGSAPPEDRIRRFLVEAERLYGLDVEGYGDGGVDLEYVEYLPEEAGGGKGRVSMVVTKRNEVSGDMESWRRGYEGRGGERDEAGRVWERMERERRGEYVARRRR